MNSLLDDHNILSLSNGLQHGEYYLGPVLPLVSPGPVKGIKEYLAKNIDTSEFVTMKILNFSSLNGNSIDDNQGKILLHNEHSVLSILQGTPGVIQHHGLFKESHRIILVLSCVNRHDYDLENRYQDFINLQHYVIQKKRLNEREALRVFYSIAATVAAIHEKNIVHRDLKLGNVVLNKRTQQITITNFTLSKHLVRQDDMLTDQRGSLAYVSPDILSGEPYYGKPCDMWSLGILLYTMLYGQFPFYDSNPHELFRKIKNAKFTIPRDIEVTSETTFLLTQLIEPNPQKRLSISEAVESAQTIYSRLSLQLQLEPMQIVPEVDPIGTSDCVVPDNDKVWSISAGSGSGASNVNFIELSTPRLSLNPFMETDHQPSGTANLFIHSTSPRPSHSPSSPVSPQIMFFPATDHHQYVDNTTPIHLTPCSNPFTQSSSSSSSNLPVDIIVSSNQPSSLSYCTSSLPIYLIPSTDTTNTTEHTTPSSHLTTPHHRQQGHRHSFSEGDSSSSFLSPHSPHVRSSTVLHGRRSLGSMLGTRPQRRNSHHNPPSLSSYSEEQQPPRTRRRSHEPRDSERDLLQGLQDVANRTSRSSTFPGNNYS